MLLRLKEYLKNNNIVLSEKEISNIRALFNKALNYNEMDNEKPIHILEDIYKNFKDMYSYCGEVYRGVFINNLSQYDKRNEICSFTTNLNVAENFAMKGDKGNCYIITQEVCNELDFASLLNDLCEKKILLEDDVFNFIGEDEILCYHQENCKVTKLCTLD